MGKEHFNHGYDGGSPNLPVGVGDIYYCQDLDIDFNFLLERAGMVVKDFLSDNIPVIISGLIPTKGSGNTLNITAGVGYAELSVTVISGSSWAIPPTMTTRDLDAIRITATQQVDMACASAVLDDVTTNYVKLKYKLDDVDTRNKAKKVGSYTYRVSESFEYVVDDVAPTDYDICLGSFVSVSNNIPSTIDIVTYRSPEYSDLIKDVALKYDLSADNLTLKTNSLNWLTASGLTVNLPASANEGDSVKLYTEFANDILQTDSEHLMNYKDNYFTTKGASGYASLAAFNSLSLVYRGVYDYIQIPGVKLSDPATLPANTGNEIRFSSDNTYLGVSCSSSPYVYIYKRSGDTFTKLSDPATLPAGYGYAICWSSDDTYFVVSHGTSPYVTIYKRSGDTFTKLSDPATLPAGNGAYCAFSNDDTYLAIAHNGSPFLTIYKRSGDVFTKLSDPATLPANYGQGCAWSSDDTYLAVTHYSTPFLTIYKRSGDVFTKLSDPATLPPNNGTGPAFSPDDTYLAIPHLDSPYVTIYKRSGDTFTKLSDPATLPAGNGICATWDSSGNYLVIAHNSSPYLTIYQRSGDTFAKITDPATLPTGNGTGCDFALGDEYLAISHLVTPFLTIYKQSFTANKTWMVEALQSDESESSIFN